MISRNSSRLVFFLRPLYSMSVNVPCFTSFTALICWLYYIIFYRFVHGFDSIRGSCTKMVKKKVNIKILQYLMGHANAATTLNIYSHVNFEDAQAEIEDSLMIRAK